MDELELNLNVLLEVFRGIEAEIQALVFAPGVDVPRSKTFRLIDEQPAESMEKTELARAANRQRAAGIRTVRRLPNRSAGPVHNEVGESLRSLIPP